MKRMLISVDLEESRAAVVDDNQLVHLEIEPVNRDSVKGNIYRGVVARVEQSLQSAFVDFGRDKQGFLPVGEIHPKIKGGSTDKRTPIQDILRAGQEILVQVTKDEIGNKGATLTTFISLPGRYLVLMPESDKTGVSRKLSDAARDRVKEITEKMKVPDGFGLIVRTAGERATKLELTKDLVYLNRLWKHIETGSAQGKGPTALYHERSLAIRFVRDYFKGDINEIVVDDEDTLGEVQAYLKVLMPRNLSAVERYSGVIPLFARYGIAGQVEDVFSRQVPLPGGGSIVIDQTEALVAVDVNSGRVKGKDIEETARQTNIEAAREVARQLVLRDLGGLVVVDFIDMRDRKYVREVEAALKSAMKMDKARHKIGRISEFGLMELSRQRLKSSVNKGVFESCVHCSGTGFYRTTESVAASVMRRIHELVAKGDVAYLVVTMPPEAANYLLNAKRAELANVEREYHVSVEVVGVEGMTAAQVTIEHLQRLPSKSGAAQIREARFKRVTRRLDLVRNKLLNREEARIERRLSVELSGASVDYADVYNGVIADTAGVAEEARVDDERKAERRRRERARRAAPAPVAPVIAEPVVDIMAASPAPQPQGFTSWLKGLFGFGGKPANDLALTVEEPAPAPAPEPAAAADAAADAAPEPRERDSRGDDDSQRKRSRRRRRRDEDGDTRDDERDRREASGRSEGDSRRRGRRRDAAADDAGQSDDAGKIEASEAGDAGESPRESADANDDDDNRRRRRRRRRRGGRRRSRDEVDGQEAGGEDGEARSDDDAASAAGADDGDAAGGHTEGNTGGRRGRGGRKRSDAGTQDASGADAAASATADGPAAASGVAAEPVLVNVRALADERIAALRAAHGLPTPTVDEPAEPAGGDAAEAAEPSGEAASGDATAANGVTDAATDAEGVVDAPSEAVSAGAESAEAGSVEAGAHEAGAADAGSHGNGAEPNGVGTAEVAGVDEAVTAAGSSGDQVDAGAAAVTSAPAPEAPPLPRGIPAVIDMRSGGQGSGR